MDKNNVERQSVKFHLNTTGSNTKLKCLERFFFFVFITLNQLQNWDSFAQGCLETTPLTEKIMLFADTWSGVVKYKCLREEIRAFPQPSPTISNQRVNKYGGEKTTMCCWPGSDSASRQKQRNPFCALITPVLPNKFNKSKTSSLMHEQCRFLIKTDWFSYLIHWSTCFSGTKQCKDRCKQSDFFKFIFMLEKIHISGRWSLTL